MPGSLLLVSVLNERPTLALVTRGFWKAECARLSKLQGPEAAAEGPRARSVVEVEGVVHLPGPGHQREKVEKSRVVLKF